LAAAAAAALATCPARADNFTLAADPSSVHPVLAGYLTFVTPLPNNTAWCPIRLQSVDPNAKLSDPKHHTVQRLAEFLAGLSSQAPDPRAPSKELVKPQKLLKRLLPWLQKCRQVRDAASHSRITYQGAWSVC
jgi:hypothetical protein